jgi:hypothetical protein
VRKTVEQINARHSIAFLAEMAEIIVVLPTA